MLGSSLTVLLRLARRGSPAMIVSMPSVPSECRTQRPRGNAAPSSLKTGVSPISPSFHAPSLFKNVSRTHKNTSRLASSSQQAQPSLVQAKAPAPTPGSGYRKKSRTKEDLKDPAQIGATGTSNFKVVDYGGSVSLAAYMMLPVEQYFVLDPKQIRWIEGNRFQLKVPRIELLGIWLEPEVEISVSAAGGHLVLTAENCRIRGSDLIENMRLDQRFCLRFETEITWKTDSFDGLGASSASSDGSDLDDSPRAPVGQGQILGNARLDVWSEVIPPFNLMPREVLQGSCNLVMSGLVGSLLPLFLQRLGKDYARWATDTQYRLGRAARTKPLS